MRRIVGKTNTNTAEFWNSYYTSIESEDDRLIIYQQLWQALVCIPFKTVLEIGCGTGVGAEYLKSRFTCHYTGSDFVPAAIEKASKYCDEAVLIDVLIDPIPAHYDVIIIAETLEHLEDPFSVIDKCLPHCKFLVLSLPYNEPEDCDPEHVWCGIVPNDFIEKYNVYIISMNEGYFQIILTHGNKM
jgi:2-polyprenyl-3-methyl-5-hydroxy-6-metoxy-1,4-benzoquinol methylase